MAVRTKDEIFLSIREHFGDDTSDATLALVEDITDTINNYDNNANNGTNWEQKYRENDEAWRKKYRDRFFSGGKGDEDDDDKPQPTKKLTYENLFKEG